MGEKLQMAHSKQDGGVLLDSEGLIGVRKEKPARSRNKRSDSIKLDGRTKAGKAFYLAEKSKDNAKAKVRSATANRAEGCRPADKVGEQVREPERTDDSSRRSAEQLGIRFPEHTCLKGKAHHYTSSVTASGGDIFLCQYCFVPLWLPNSYNLSQQFGTDLRHKGEAAYWAWLDKRPRLRDVMAMLWDLRHLRGKVSDDRLREIVLNMVGNHTMKYRKQLMAEGILERTKHIKRATPLLIEEE